jgi:hypothetical protein
MPPPRGLPTKRENLPHATTPVQCRQRRLNGHGRIFKFVSGRGSAWLERLVRDQEVGGSNPLAPILLLFACCIFRASLLGTVRFHHHPNLSHTTFSRPVARLTGKRSRQKQGVNFYVFRKLRALARN